MRLCSRADSVPSLAHPVFHGLQRRGVAEPYLRNKYEARVNGLGSFSGVFQEQSPLRSLQPFILLTVGRPVAAQRRWVHRGAKGERRPPPRSGLSPITRNPARGIASGISLAKRRARKGETYGRTHTSGPSKRGGIQSVLGLRRTSLRRMRLPLQPAVVACGLVSPVTLYRRPVVLLVRTGGQMTSTLEV